VGQGHHVGNAISALGNPGASNTNPPVVGAVQAFIDKGFGASDIFDNDCSNFSCGSSTGTAAVSTYEEIIVPAIMVT